MPSPLYPFNALQREIHKRCVEWGLMTAAMVAAVACSMVFSPHTYAASPFDLVASGTVISVNGHDGASNHAVHLNSTADYPQAQPYLGAFGYLQNYAQRTSPPTLPSAFPHDFTVEFWSYAHNDSAGYIFLDTNGSLSTNQKIKVLYTGHVLSVVFNGTTQYYSNDCTANATDDLNEWHFLAVTYDHTAQEIKFYKDGVYCPGDTFATAGETAGSTTTDRIVIGSSGEISNGATADLPNASIDEMRIEKVARTSVGIALDYIQNELSPTINTWALWHFDNVTTDAPAAAPSAGTLLPEQYTSEYGSPVSYNLTWSGLDFSPSDAKFYEDSGATVYPIASGGLGSGGTLSFLYRFPHTGTFHPIAKLSDSSHTFIISQTGAEIVQLSNLSQQFPSTFRFFFDQHDFFADTTHSGSYALSSSLCAPGTVTGRRMFKGYPDVWQYRDSGAVLSSRTGYFSMSFEDDPTHSYYPYIRSYCSDGNSYDVFLGGLVLRNNVSNTHPAGAVRVDITQDENANSFTWTGGNNGTTTPFINGGFSRNYATGTGAMFRSDGTFYHVGEDVGFEWIFNSPFSVSGAVLYKDPDLLTGTGDILTYDSASARAKNTTHIVTVQYDTPGDYQPMLQVRSNAYDSGDPSTYENIYLGGEHTKNPLFALRIAARGSPSTIGSFFGSSGAAIGGVDKNGIFSLGVFTGFEPTGNWFFDQAMKLLAIVLEGLMKVLSRIYDFFLKVPFIRSIDDMLGPPPGSSYCTPDSIAGVTITATFPVRCFTVAYNTDPRAELLTKLLQFAFGIGILNYILRHVMNPYKRPSPRPV